MVFPKIGVSLKTCGINFLSCPSTKRQRCLRVAKLIKPRHVQMMSLICLLRLSATAVLLSEGADCHRDLKRALLSLKIPIENTGGQGYLPLYPIDTKARLVRSAVRLNDSGKGTKHYTIQKQAENAWVDKG